MDRLIVLRLLRRWPVVILSAMLVAGLVTGLQLRTAAPVYEAEIKLQLTAPPDEEVAVYTNYRSSYLRDEMTAALNNFTEVLQSREVYKRTAERLSLAGQDAQYEVEASPAQDSDFLSISVRARTPELAASITNAHTAEAIAWFGEIRAKPAVATRDLIAQQLEAAQQRLDRAAGAFTDFKIANGIGQLEAEFAARRALIQRLEDDRTTRLLDGSPSREAEAVSRTLEQLRIDRARAYAEGEDKKTLERYDEVIGGLANQLSDLQRDADATAALDALIQQQRAELADLMKLEPAYDALSKDVEQAEAERQLLISKQAEAALKATMISTSSSIQVVESASAPEQPVPAQTLLVLGGALVGGLGVGLLVALLLELMSAGNSLSLRKAAPMKAEKTSGDA